MYAHGPVCVRRLYSNARCSAPASAKRRFQYRLAGTGAEGTGARIKISPYAALHNSAMPGNERLMSGARAEDPVAVALRPTLSNLVQPCPTLAVAMSRTYPRAGLIHRLRLIHRLDLSTGWTYPQAGPHLKWALSRRDVGGCRQAGFFSSLLLAATRPRARAG